MKILFLGYNSKETEIINFLKKRKHIIKQTKKKVTYKIVKDFDIIISFGYKYKISSHILNKFKKNIINLHISYLPWNKGADPNFWSFFDNTPKGITIHKIDENIDTGPILYQKKIKFMKNEDTFFLTYKRLITEIEKLFFQNYKNILSNKFNINKQDSMQGTKHFSHQLPKFSRGWHANIDKTIKKLKKEKFWKKK